MELIRALGTLSEPPTPQHQPIADVLGLGPLPESSVYTDVFLFHVYPYASVYLSETGMMGGEPVDRIAGFWRAVGLAPPGEPDHLGALLGLLASLVERTGAESEPAEALLLANARDTLLTEYLLAWLPAYCHTVQILAPDFYAAWAALLERTLKKYAQSIEGQEDGGLHPMSIQGVPDPRVEGGEAFLSALLAPARSGMILTRADLARGARALALGFRLGERAYQLRALLSQDPGAVLDWLGGEASRWAAWHRRHSWAPRPARGRWADRSGALAELLRELRDEGWSRDASVEAP